MIEVAAAIAAIPFILGTYRFGRLGGRVSKSRQRPWLVLCARMKCISLIRTETMPGAGKPALAVRHCVLWPTLQGCDQRCVK